jgi:hypothetical protein
MESEQHKGANGDLGDEAHRFGERLGGTAQEAWNRTRNAVGDIKGSIDLQGRVNRHPYGTIAVALGIGYALGGGIFSRLTGRLVGLGLRIGLKAAVLPLMRDELLGLADALRRGGPGERTRQADTNKEREP